MRQYIKDLTDNLIGKNRYDDDIWRRIQDADEFLKFVKLDLGANDVRHMKAETLGKILCSLDIGDVMASKEEIFGDIHFNGDCEDMLREMVALALAYVIRSRVDRSTKNAHHLPAYNRQAAI